MRLVAPLTPDSDCKCNGCAPASAVIPAFVVHGPSVPGAQPSPPKPVREVLWGGSIALRHLFDVPMSVRFELNAGTLLFRGRLGLALSFDDPSTAYVDRFELSGQVEPTSGRAYGSLSVTSKDGPATRLGLKSSKDGFVILTASLDVLLSLQLRRGLERVDCDSARVEVEVRVPVESSTHRVGAEEYGIASLSFSLHGQAMGRTSAVNAGRNHCYGYTRSSSPAIQRVLQVQSAAARIQIAVVRRDVAFAYARARLGRRLIVQPHFIWPKRLVDEDRDAREVAAEAAREEERRSHLVRHLLLNGIGFANDVWNKVGVFIGVLPAQNHDATGKMGETDGPGSSVYDGNPEGYDDNNTRWMQAMVAGDLSVTHVFYFQSYAREDSGEGKTPGGTFRPLGNRTATGAPNAYIVTATSPVHSDFDSGDAQTARYHLAHELGHVLGVQHPTVPDNQDRCYAVGGNYQNIEPGTVNGSPNTVACSDTPDDRRSKNSVWNGLYATRNARMIYVFRPFEPDYCDPRTVAGDACAGKLDPDRRRVECVGIADPAPETVGCAL